MDDLQDAIQDAQYVGEMCDPAPRPTRRMALPTVEDAAGFEAELTSDPRRAAQLEFPFVMSKPLGLYLFSKYLREVGCGRAMAFLEDVAAYSVISKPRLRLRKAHEINSMYLLRHSRRGDDRVGAASELVSVGSLRDGWLDSSSVLLGEGVGVPRVIKTRLAGGERVKIAVSTYEALRDDDALLGVSGEMLDTLAKRIDGQVIRRMSVHGYLDSHKSLVREKSASLGKLHKEGTAGDVAASGKEAEGSSEEKTATGEGGGSGGSGAPPEDETDGSTEPTLPAQLFDDLSDIVLEGLRATHYAAFRRSPDFVKYLQFVMIEDRVVGPDDFSLFRILGRGGFGAVNGCKKCDTGKLYAMKMLNKKRVKKRGAEALCLNERHVLAMVHSPFLVQLKYAYQTREDLVLILDIMTGGDLSFHLSRESRFDEERARFYAAQTLLGLEHMHSLRIIYRDLKPENLLLDGHGNLRISDMGLACMYTPKVAGRCGTRGYWAPEMLIKPAGKRNHYDYAVDWWSFGCVIYEMLEGHCPFRTAKARKLDSDRHKATDKATLEMDVDYDREYFSEEAEDLLRALLERDPAKRLGKGGADEIKKHPWFSTVDWGMMEAQLVVPPFVPEQNVNAASQEAIGMFDDVTDVSLRKADHERFEGWEAIDSVAYQHEIVEYLTWEEREGPIVPVPVGDACCSIQ